MIRICACGVRISDSRLFALPNAVNCIVCALKDDVQKTVGIMLWDHKTAPFIEIGTALARQEAGKKHSYGPHFRLGSKSPSANTVIASANTEVAFRLFTTDTLLTFPSRCHPDRSRIGPSGLCLPCSLELQDVRFKVMQRTK